MTPIEIAALGAIRDNIRLVANSMNEEIKEMQEKLSALQLQQVTLVANANQIDSLIQTPTAPLPTKPTGL